ncbi:MAG TPA: outer membrane beta-barrel family protein [Sphingobacteriaceae bacterium]
MKRLLLTILLFPTFIAGSFGQLRGRLTDPKNSPVPFASVSVVRQDSVPVAGTVTDEQGAFTLNPQLSGTFRLRLSAMGFVTRYTEPFTTKANALQKDFGDLVLSEDTRLLGEVTVKGLRPSITVKPDRMVVDVEGSALASGSSAFEVLEKAPGVWIDQDGNIMLNGKSGVRVMINERLTYLSGKELQTLLESMSADQIRSLEVITNPSAKYEAAGSSGILNIRLKGNTVQGMNGSVHAGYQYNSAIGYTAGASVNYKTGPWNSFVNADMARRPRIREGVMIREFHSETANTSFHQLRNEDMTLRAPSLRLGTDLQLSERHSIGGIINWTFNTTDRSFLSETGLHDRLSDRFQSVSADNFNSSGNTGGAFNLHYKGHLDTAGTGLSVELDYIKLDNSTDSRYENLYRQDAGEQVQERLRSENPGYYDIYSLNADFNLNLSKRARLESGIRASHVLSGNELNFYRMEAGGQQRDESRSNHYWYRENILAAYVSYSTRLGDKWTIQAGLRGEQTHGRGRQVDGNGNVSKSYLDLFPSVFVTQKPGEAHQITYNYSRRIDRPNYRTMNPFIFYLDPYSWSEGNPDLRPQYTHSFQVTQTLKNQYSLMLGYSSTKDFFAEVPRQDPETSTTVYQERNIDRVEDLSATLIAPVRITRSWETSNNLVAGLQKNRMFLSESEMKNNQLFFTAQSVHNLLLPYGFQFQATAAYSSPSAFGVYRFESQWWLDAGLKKAIWKKKLDLSVGATDIFRTRDVHGDASYNGNVFRFVNYFMMRSVRVNLRYSFQRGQDFRSRNQKVSLDELNRAGG